MDFIEGEDLRERMERVGVVPEDDVIVIGAAMCDALTYLHSRTPTILHRDIKPGNVKIAPNGHIVLLDFGLAKVVEGDQPTTVGARAMTPGYSPPEQYGTARTDPRSDIYSLGATLYAAASGVIPEDGLARAMENAQLAPLRRRSPGTSRKFALAIEKAMAVDPMDRFQNAEEFKRALLISKSKTQQPVGAYTITPPPLIETGINTAAPAVKSKKVATSGSSQEQPFLTPRKRLGMRARRIRRTILLALLGLIVAGYASAEVLAPGMLTASAQRLFGAFASTEVVSTPRPSATPQPSAAMTPIDEPVVALPTQTQTAVPGPALPAGFLSREVAFASTRSGLPQVFITSLDPEGQPRQLTYMNEGACQPSWSPDGMRLVFVSPCKVRQDTYRGSSLYVINYDGSGLLALNTVPGGDFEPAWSPDGQHIAFTSVRTGKMQIYSYDLKSTVTQRVTLRDSPQLFGKDARQPAWSSNGSTIIFALRHTEKAFSIWTISSLGRDEEQLVRSGDKVSDFNPEWSPDMKLLLFSRTPADRFAFPKLVTLQMDDKSGQEPLETTFDLLSITNVDFSPDGAWLAFETSGDKGGDVAYMQLSGANKTVIAPSDYEDFNPVWRPMPGVDVTPTPIPTP
jgi:Tol biopolymer transport system component